MKIAIALVAGVAATAVAQPITANYDRPTSDVWNYPFNQSFSTGLRAAGSTFAAFGFPGQFDARDAQVLTNWDTSAQFTPGQGVSNYEVTSATLTFTTTAANDGAFVYDPTQDPVESFGDLAPATIADADAGRPLELFGTGFRGFPFPPNPLSYPGPGFGQGSPVAEGVRSAFAADVSSGSLRDVSNNVRDGFETTPFAIGTTTAVAPGQAVPGGTVFTFEINLSDPAIEAYLAEGLNNGALSFSLSSHHTGSFGGPPTFPSFNLDGLVEVVGPGGLPTLVPTTNVPTLSITANVIPAPGAAAALGLAGLAATRRRR